MLLQESSTSCGSYWSLLRVEGDWQTDQVIIELSLSALILLSNLHDILNYFEHRFHLKGFSHVIPGLHDIYDDLCRLHSKNLLVYLQKYSGFQEFIDILGLSQPILLKFVFLRRPAVFI